MCALINHVVSVPLWAALVFLLLIGLLIMLDGWRASQWQHVALLSSRIQPARHDYLPDPAAALAAAAASLSNPPDDRHTRSIKT
jgi:hypothetical protein